MSQENVEVVRRLYSECWAAANLDLVPEVLHPGIVWTGQTSYTATWTLHRLP